MDVRRLMNECPAVIGVLTSTIESGGSIDTAVRAIAEDGPRHSRQLFLDSVRDADTKGSPSLTSSLSSRLSELPEEASGYRRAVMMAVSASESSDEIERTRMLRDSAQIALEAVKEMGEAYGASLTVPCMTVFGIGIMMPMILMSILPMLSIGGMFETGTIDNGAIVLITLVMIPAIILAVSVYLRSRNPFLTESFRIKDLRCLLPIFCSIPLGLIAMRFTDDSTMILLLSLAPACVVCVILMAGGMRGNRVRLAGEQALMDCVFDIGNRMLGGTNFETAAVEASAVRKESEPVSRMLSREFALCRGDVGAAVSCAVEPVSREMSMALCSIQACSERDTEDAGRLAVTLGKQFQSRNAAKRDLEMKLKSTTDMMAGTAMVFSPLVLGLSVSMLEPLTKLAGELSLEGTSTILGIYLVELNALIAILLSSLGSGDGVLQTVWRFCIMCPISLAVFWVCSGISL